MPRGDSRDDAIPCDLLFQRNLNPMWVCDTATLAFVAVNDAAITRYGYSREEFLGMTVRDIRPPEELPRLEAWLALPHASRPVPVEARHRTKDGTILDVEVYTTRFEADGGARRTLVCAVDVTARRRAERAARAAEHRLRKLIDKSFDGFSITAGDGTILYVNSAFARMLGYEASEALGQSGATWMHPDDRERESPAYTTLLRTPNATHITLSRMRHKDGSWRWIECSLANLLHDEDVRAVVATFRDVTDRVRAEEALREAHARVESSEQSFRALLDRLPRGVLVHRAGRIVYANKTAASLLGYDDAAQLRERAIDDLLHPGWHASVHDRIEALASGARAYNSPECADMVRCDGTTVTVEAEALRVDFGGERAVLALLQDVTERRAMLARLAVADRMRSVGMLAAGVAHELNNPLAYVIANLSLLSEHVHTPGGRLGPVAVGELVRDALDGAARLRDIVRDMKMLSRSDDAADGTTDLREVIESCVKMAQLEIRFRARLVVDLEPLPRVRGSASRLGQVFLNLLVNAAQAVPEGHAAENEIVVRARRRPGAEVVVEVADTGCGVAPSIVGRIFDPFFTTKPPGEGTGLGLAICHGIVKSVGGNIEVESTPGRGSTFRVLLPIATEAAGEHERAPVDSPSIRRARILVVDDEPAIGRSLSLMLDSEHDVVAVTHAREALARIDAGETFDVVLCDLTMPEMSGAELYSVIEQAHPSLARRIVFITGGAFTDTTRALLARDEHRRLDKPFDERALRATIGRVLAEG